MQRLAVLLIPGVGDILGDFAGHKGKDFRANGVAGAGEPRPLPRHGRRLRQRIIAVGEKPIGTPAEGIEPRMFGKTQEKTHLAFAVGLLFEQPGVEVVDAYDFLPPGDGAAEDGPFIPGAEAVDDHPALEDLRDIGRRSDPTGHHKGSMRPLAADDGHHLQETFALPDGLNGNPAGERAVAGLRLLA
ncbi:MAG: hypothetical protein ACD_75C02135G0001 [uncultured bacterium]|nr:MAG: hypothetical protein ACD_75C02135G0001 [uncultured bacterium]